MKFLDVPRSGSYQGVTSSHNRYGQYLRTRAIPVNPNTAAQGSVRGRLSAASAAWRGLTDEQRAGWEALAGGIARSDALGSSYSLNGFGAFTSVNLNLLTAGDAQVTDAPVMLTPSAPTIGAITCTAAAFTIAFTPALGAQERMLVYASPQRSAGRSFEAQYRLVLVTAVNATSPLDCDAQYNAALGARVAGNRIFLSLHTYEAGFRSGASRTSVVVA